MFFLFFILFSLLIYFFIIKKSTSSIQEIENSHESLEKKPPASPASKGHVALEKSTHSKPLQEPFPTDILWIANKLLEAPEFASPNVYVSRPQTIEWRSPCQKQSIANEWKTLEEGLSSRGLATAEQFPRSLHLDYLNQFWKVGERHMQVSLTWQLDTPPSYKVELFSSTDPTFQSRVVYEKLSGKEFLVLDPISAYELVQRQLSAALATGGTEGSRTLMASRVLGGMKHEVEYWNGQAIKYAGGGVFCVSSANLRTSHCYCSGAQ